MLPNGGVYAIVCTVTGDCYVGSSVDIPHRWSQHRSALKRGDHSTRHLQRAYLKYGPDAFEFLLLEEVTESQQLILEREQFWIDTLEPTYNKRPVANNNFGVKHDEETRANMRAAALARAKPNEEVRKILSEAAKKRQYTEEGRRKRSESMKKWHQERPRSEELRKQIAEKNRETWAKKSKEEKHEYTQKRPPVSEATRQKQREAKLGKKQSPEFIQKRVEGRQARRKAAQAAQALQQLLSLDMPDSVDPIDITQIEQRSLFDL